MTVDNPKVSPQKKPRRNNKWVKQGPKIQDQCIIVYCGVPVLAQWNEILMCKSNKLSTRLICGNLHNIGERNQRISKDVERQSIFVD